MYYNSESVARISAESRNMAEMRMHKENGRYLCNGLSDPLYVYFQGRVFEDGGSNGWRYFRFDQMQDGDRSPSWKISSGDISATGHPIYFMFGSRVGLLGSTDRMDLSFRLKQIQEAAARHLYKFRMNISLEWVIRSTFMDLRVVL